MITKKELKDVFMGASHLLFTPDIVDLSKETLQVTPKYDLPVEVDTLQISQGDHTINHYKVIGMDNDWCSSATVGDSSFQFTVPTKAVQVLEMAYGKSAVNTIKKLTINTGDSDIDSASGYSGTAIKLKKKKVTGTFIIVDEEKNNLFIITNVAVWAKPMFDNASTKPFAIQFSGTIEGADEFTMSWLTKGDGVVALEYATDKATTRKLVPEGQRRTGLVITYNTGSAVVKEMYVDTRTTDEEWEKDDNWEPVS